MTYAILDIGSNTVKMSVFDANRTVIAKYSQPTALLSYVQAGRLSPEGIAKLTETVANYRKTAEGKHSASVFAYATASLRGLSNTDEVIATVNEKTGVLIDLVSGELEAKLAFDGIAAVSGEDPYTDTVFDQGGGSLEIALQQDGGFYTRSYPLGALAVHLRFVKNILPTKDELRRVYAYAQSLIDPDTPKLHGRALTVGGTLRAVCRVIAAEKGESYSEKRSYTVTRDEAIALLERIVNCDTQTKLMLISLVPKRIHTLATGLTAFLALLDTSGQTAFTVVAGGTREGYLNKVISE